MRGVSPSQTLPIAGGKPPAPPHLNLHDAAGPERRRDDHDRTTSRRTASQPSPYPNRRRHTIQQCKRDAVLPTGLPDGQLQTHQDAGQADAGSCVCFCAHPYDTGVGTTEPTFPPMFVYVQGRSRRRASQPVKPRQRTQRKDQSEHRKSAQQDRYNHRVYATQTSTSPRPTTSPGDIAGRCTALAVVLVSVTASVPPVTTAAPRRTWRSPPRVLFPGCAGSCTCPLRAPAPRPTIDAGQGPTDRLAPLTSLFAFLLSVRAADTLSKRAICTISGYSRRSRIRR